MKEKNNYLNLLLVISEKILFFKIDNIYFFYISQNNKVKKVSSIFFI